MSLRGYTNDARGGSLIARYPLIAISLTGGVVLLLAACNPYVVQDARITGSGSYETGGGTQTAAKGKSKVKGYGSPCSDADECEHWGLDCARHICTFPCKTDQDCAEAKGHCVARVASSLPDVPKVCTP